MGRDFARKGKRQPSRSRAKNTSYHWSWLLAGTLIGILVSGIAFFKLFPTVYPLLVQSQVEAEAPKAVSKPAPEEKAKRAPQFDFYSLLPELEVGVPKAAPKPAAKATPQNTEQKPPELSQKPAGSVTYRLQLASFRAHQDADRLKAQMALTGMQVEIETVSLAPNDTWYRVRTTPYPDKASAETARAQLQAQSIQSLLLEEQG